MRKLLHDYAVHFSSRLCWAWPCSMRSTPSVRGDFSAAMWARRSCRWDRFLRWAYRLSHVILAFSWCTGTLPHAVAQAEGAWSLPGVGYAHGQERGSCAGDMLVAAVSFGGQGALRCLSRRSCSLSRSHVCDDRPALRSSSQRTRLCAHPGVLWRDIFVVMMLFNWITLRVRLIDLMSSARQNEKQFVRRLRCLSIVLTAAGLVLMGVAYWRLIGTDSPWITPACRGLHHHHHHGRSGHVRLLLVLSTFTARPTHIRT